MKQKRSGYVVRQVADHAQVVPHCREIELERVAIMNGQPTRRMAGAQILHDIAVDFDCYEMLEALQQGHRLFAQPGAERGEAVAGLRLYSRHDLLHHTRIFEEILAKTLAWLVHVSRVSRSDCGLNSASTEPGRMVYRSSTIRLRLPGAKRIDSVCAAASVFLEAQFDVGAVTLLAYPSLVSLLPPAPTPPLSLLP